MNKPSHEQMMAGYAIACRFGVYERQAFDLAEEMFKAMNLETRHVVATKRPDGQIVAVSIQNDDHSILSVIAESGSPQSKELISHE